VLGTVVINCAGIVKQRTEFPDSYFVMVNGYGPHRLAEACDTLGLRLISVSTDCVFAGPGPHNESDSPDGRGIYAVSKLAGEVTRAPHLTIRTSFVGAGRRGLLHDLTQKRGQTISAPSRLWWTGHTAGTIARLLVALAERPDVTGLLHVPARPISRPRLVELLSERYELGITVGYNDEPADDRRLVSERWAGLGLAELPTFVEQLKEMTV
jgi:dTDP-4-dehydrorhamnose reductase